MGQSRKGGEERQDTTQRNVRTPNELTCLFLGRYCRYKASSMHEDGWHNGQLIYTAPAKERRDFGELCWRPKKYYNLQKNRNRLKGGGADLPNAESPKHSLFERERGCQHGKKSKKRKLQILIFLLVKRHVFHHHAASTGGDWAHCITPLVSNTVALQVRCLVCLVYIISHHNEAVWGERREINGK